MITQRLSYKTAVFLLISFIVFQNLEWMHSVHAGACNTKEGKSEKPRPSLKPTLPEDKPTLTRELLISQLKEPRCESDFLAQLISQGADVNYEDGHRRTPLAYAILNNHIEAVALLLDSGVNVNCTVDRNDRSAPMTAVVYAASHRRNEILGELIKRGAKLSQLNGVALVDQLLTADNPGDQLQRLVSQGADVNYRRPNHSQDVNEYLNESTSLAYAILDNQIEIASLLLHAGANPNELKHTPTYQGDTSLLELAAVLGRTEILEELIKQGAKLSRSVKNQHLRHGAYYSGKFLALALALENHHDASARLLLVNGCSPDESIRSNSTLSDRVNSVLSELAREKQAKFKSEMRKTIREFFECEGQQAGQDIIPKDVVTIIESYL